MFQIWRILTVLIGLGLSGCVSITPNSLSAADTAALQFTSVEVRVPEVTQISWSAMEDEYVRSQGLTVGDPTLLRTPEARAYIREQAGRRLKVALERVIADRQSGTRPVRLVATLTAASIPSAAQRILIGGNPTVAADVEILDVRTGAVLTSYRGGTGWQLAGQGIGGTLIDAAIVAGGMDDLFERAARNYASGFQRWLAAN